MSGSRGAEPGRWSSIAFWAGFGLVLPQALWVRKRAPRSPEAGGPRDGAFGEGDPISLVGLGDSIIAGVGARTLDNAILGQTARVLAERSGRQCTYRCLGRSGDRAKHIIHEQLPALEKLRPPQFFLVSVGVNDVTGLTSPARFAQQLTRIFDALGAYAPGSRVLFCGLPPLRSFPLLPQPLRMLLGMRSRQLEATARAITDQRDRVCHLGLGETIAAENFSEDGYHPSEASYARLAEAMVDRYFALTQGSLHC